jgi:hypothetical protein
MNATYRTTEYLGTETITGLTFDEVADYYQSCGFGRADQCEILGSGIVVPSDIYDGQFVLIAEEE